SPACSAAIAWRQLFSFEVEEHQPVVLPSGASCSALVRVPQSAESIVHRARGVRNKLETSVQPTYAPKARGWASASLALYFFITQVRTAPIPRAVTIGTGPAHAKGSEVSMVTTTRKPTSAPSGVRTSVSTVFG